MDSDDPFGARSCRTPDNGASGLVYTLRISICRSGGLRSFLSPRLFELQLAAAWVHLRGIANPGYPEQNLRYTYTFQTIKSAYLEVSLWTGTGTREA